LRENDTACGSGGNASAQGDWQVWPCAVRTSAPGGSDSNCTVCNCGADWSDSQLGIETDPQPASATAVAAITAALTKHR
jgi:hypothetical protein